MRYFIGIDPGVHTGIALWDSGLEIFRFVRSMTITGALTAVRNIEAQHPRDVKVVFEDARQRRWIPDTRNLRREMGRRQGADSVKRDCAIWEEFCSTSGIPYEAVAPGRNRTKLDAEVFRSLTGWADPSNEHARDAAMLVFGR